jgi:hypothetical protein
MLRFVHKNLIVTGIVCFALIMAVKCLAESSFYPKLSVGQVSKDLNGQKVADWHFARDDHKAVQILDGHYDGDMAEVRVYVLVIDGRGNHGRKGRLRLKYEWTVDEWKLIHIKPLVFARW